jgi:hypothetical protein
MGLQTIAIAGDSDNRGDPASYDCLRVSAKK